MRVLAPAVVEVRRQEYVRVPARGVVPAASVQLAAPSFTDTLPVGVPVPALRTTETFTVYACPTREGFGVLAVIRVVVFVAANAAPAGMLIKRSGSAPIIKNFATRFIAPTNEVCIDLGCVLV